MGTIIVGLFVAAIASGGIVAIDAAFIANVIADPIVAGVAFGLLTDFYNALKSA